MSAFAVLMASAKRKADELDADAVIGIGYEAKLCGEGVDPDDPLYGTCYYGIAVRRGYASPEALQMERQREHETAAKSDPKELGVRAILARYGSRALVWRVVESKTGDRVSTQEWANEWEKRAIAAAGGVLRDMEPIRPIRQTFNLTAGGAWGTARAWWVGIEAKSTAAWKRFQSALEAYVHEYKTARVTRDYINATGYLLGENVASVRCGGMIKGKPDEVARRAFLDALPGWTWNCLDFAWDAFKVAMQKYVDEFKTARVHAHYKNKDQYALGEALSQVRTRGAYLSGKLDEKERRAWLEALPDWSWNLYDDAWEEFKVVICNHVRKTGSAYAPQSYVDENAYPIGGTIAHVRKGMYLNGKRDEVERRAWLNTLPGWKWKMTRSESAAETRAELELLRATTHPTAKMQDIKQLRDAHCVIRAHEVLRDRAVSSAIDDLLDRVMARVVTRMEVK